MKQQNPKYNQQQKGLKISKRIKIKLNLPRRVILMS